MKITRVAEQSPETIEEFYAQLLEDQGITQSSRNTRRKMLDLLAMLKSIEGPDVWVSTSMLDMNFVYQDPKFSNGGVRVSYIDRQDEPFHVDYTLKTHDPDWDVTYHARSESIEKACQLIQHALYEIQKNATDSPTTHG